MDLREGSLVDLREGSLVDLREGSTGGPQGGFPGGPQGGVHWWTSGRGPWPDLITHGAGADHREARKRKSLVEASS